MCHRFDRILMPVLFLLCLLLALPVSAGKLVRVAADLELYYEDSGTGSPIIFIPMWTGTTAFYRQQIEYFSRHYHAITYDPRGQGRSSKTLHGNDYTQHGEDLAAFMRTVGLRNVILVGHSFGCQTTYAYFRRHGHGNVKAFVCIDSPPKYMVDAETDWGLLKHPRDMKGFHDGMAYDRLKTTQDFVQSMFPSPLPPTQRDTLVTEMMKTPDYVTLLLDYDAAMADFTADARQADGKIPVLNMLAEPGWFDGWTATARAWLKANTPHASVVSFGGHMMPLEMPARFNKELETFLQQIK